MNTSRLSLRDIGYIMTTAAHWNVASTGIGSGPGGAANCNPSSSPHRPESRSSISPLIESGMESAPFLRSHARVRLDLHLPVSVSTSLPSDIGQYLGEGGSNRNCRQRCWSNVSCDRKGVYSSTAFGCTFTHKKSGSKGCTLAKHWPSMFRK